MRRPLRLLALFALFAFIIGFTLGACSSSSPTPAAKPVPVVTPQVTPAPVLEAKAPVAVPADETAAAKGTTTLVVASNPKGGLLVGDVPVPDGVTVDANAAQVDPKKGTVSGPVTVKNSDPKKPALKCPADKKDHCDEKADGSITVHLASAH